MRTGDLGDEDLFPVIDLACLRCGRQADPVALASGMVILRCPSCGLVTI